jgi:hypothetical protein
MDSSQQSQYHTRANAFPSQQELDNWTKVSYNWGRLAQNETERETKHMKESVHWLNQTFISNRNTALLQQDSEDSTTMAMGTRQNLLQSI